MSDAIVCDNCGEMYDPASDKMWMTVTSFGGPPLDTCSKKCAHESVDALYGCGVVNDYRTRPQEDGR